MIRNFFAQYNSLGRLFVLMSCGALIVDVGMSYEYGINLSWFHALGFALCALFMSFLPDAAYRQYEEKKYASCVVVAILCVPLTMIAYYTHFGYTVGQGRSTIDLTEASQASYKRVNSVADSSQANLAMWQAHLKDLMEKNNWVATVSADALRMQISDIDEKIRQEKLRGGCGPICSGLQLSREPLAKQLGIIEEVADYRKQINATEALVAANTNVATKTELKVNPVKYQTESAASIVDALYGTTLDTDEPNKKTLKFTQLSIWALGALGSVIMAPIGFFVAGRNRQILPSNLVVGSIKNNLTADTPVQIASVVAATQQHKVEPTTITVPITVTPTVAQSPVNVAPVSAQVAAPVSEPVSAIVSQPRDTRILKVRDTAFARRVAAITAPLREAA